MSLNTGTNEPKEVKVYFWALDPLRFLLATWVVFFHWSQMSEFSLSFQFDVNTYVSRFLGIGWTSVQVFFVISGLVIAQSCLGTTTAAFLSKRFGRLAPWILFSFPLDVLILTWIHKSYKLVPVLESITFFNWSKDFDKSFYPTYKVPSFNPVTWTLFVEILFYMIIAIFVISLGKGRKSSLISVANIWLLLLFLAPVVSSELFDKLTLRHHAPYFLLGIFLFLIVTEGRSISLIIGATLSCYFSVINFFSYPIFELMLFITSMTICIIAIFVKTPQRDLTFLRNIGNSAYPLYLLHAVIGEQILRFIFSNIQGLGIGYRGSVFSSFVLTYTILVTFSYFVSSRYEKRFRILLQRHF